MPVYLAPHVKPQKPFDSTLIHEYSHDIHGLDVLLCGEDVLSGQKGIRHHANPGEWK
jgi:hypothetical protein